MPLHKVLEKTGARGHHLELRVYPGQK